MKIDNPYIDKLRDLVVMADLEQDPKKKKQLLKQVKETEEKSREFIYKLIQNIKHDITKYQTRIEKSKRTTRFPTKTAQYRESINIYREIAGYKGKPGLIHKARLLKKLCRDQLQAGKGEDKSQTKLINI